MRTITALDWIAAALGWLLAGALILFALLYAPSFRKMFEDFGGDLPVLTRLVLTPWPALVACAIATATLVGGVALRRRALIVLGFFLALGGLGLCVAGVYLPIVEIAGAVK
jgi:hypothetical protein